MPEGLTEKELEDRRMMIAYQRFYIVVKQAVADLETKLNEYYRKEKTKDEMR